MLLPEPGGWNGKLVGVGDGSYAGFIDEDAMRDALSRGYATASTDTGHVGRPTPIEPPFPGYDASRALAASGEPDLATPKNFGYRAVHETTRVASGRTRPLRAYPARARFDGGDPDDPSSFACRP